MLDIRLIREDPEGVKARLATRGGDTASLVDELLECDEVRRACETEKQQLQSDRKRISKEIGTRKQKGEDTSEIEAQVRGIGEQISDRGAKADEADARQRYLLLSIPNLPHEGCPIGSDESANPEIRTWGEKPVIEGEAEDHVAIAARLGLVDFDAAAKISGSGFAVFTGDGARLERALIQLLLEVQTRDNGYREVSPPILISRDCMEGTGQLPKFEDDMYGLEENSMFLAPTAEVPITNLYRGMILKEAELPVKVTGYTPCFRREAGSAGRESKGLIRMHQFDKIELVKVVHPDNSMGELESLTSDAESVPQKLGLHYRVVELCTGDMSAVSAKTYDIEVWAPGHGAYLEVSSCSNFLDYQARRMNLRFKDGEGKNRFCHTLNGSGTALPRLFVALVENYQRPDGSVEIPEALRGYFGADRIS